MPRLYEREIVTVHKNEKLGEFYASLPNEQQRLIAVATVRFIMENFPKTKQELLGEKQVDYISPIRRGG